MKSWPSRLSRRGLDSVSSGIISDIWKMHFRQKELLMREENLENQSLMSMRGWNSGHRLRVQEALNDSLLTAYMTACDSLPLGLC